MLERVGLEQRDVRNLFIAMSIMSLILYPLAEGSTMDRSIAAVVGALVSGVVFLVATVLINQIKPDHW